MEECPENLGILSNNFLDKKTQMTNESSNIAHFTIGELLPRLRPTQLWSIIAAMVVLIGGTFALGRNIGQHKVEIVKDREDILEERLQLVESEQKFFVRYLRYLIAKDRFQRIGSKETEGDFKLANTMFVRQIEKWWRQQESFDGELILTRVVRKSDDPTQSRVVFADGTEWEIPSEIKRQVLERVEQ